jgi:hypothetical protein
MKFEGTTQSFDRDSPQNRRFAKAYYAIAAVAKNETVGAVLFKYERYRPDEDAPRFTGRS